MGRVRVDTALSVVATLSESIDRYWLRDSAALQQWVQDELTGEVNTSIEALVPDGRRSARVGPTPKASRRTR